MLTSKERIELSDARVRHLREEIRRWLANTGTNEAVLSKSMGLSPTGIRDFFLKERTYPKIGFLLGAAHMLGCTVSELIGEPASGPGKEITVTDDHGTVLYQGPERRQPTHVRLE